MPIKGSKVKIREAKGIDSFDCTERAKSPHCLINFTDADLFPTSSQFSLTLFCIWNWNQNKTKKEKKGLH